MARLETISVDEHFSRSLLEEFKQYASVPDDTRDALLTSLLRSAVLRVQEYADRALARTRLRLETTVPQSGLIRLYMGGGRIESVSRETGEEIAYDPALGGKVQLYTRTGKAVIVYETTPQEGDWIRLKPVVFRYATALYDGEENQTLDRILTEARL